MGVEGKQGAGESDLRLAAEGGRGPSNKALLAVVTVWVFSQPSVTKGVDWSFRLPGQTRRQRSAREARTLVWGLQVKEFHSATEESSPWQDSRNNPRMPAIGVKFLLSG